MGRFYQTSKAQMIDFSLKLPEEMMIQAVKFQDQMINKELAAYAQYTASLVGQGFGTTDEQKLKGIFQGYQDKIDSQTKELYGNVLEWRKMAPKLRTLGKNIYNDKTKGEWGAIQGNYNAHAAAVQKREELIKQNPDKFLTSDAEKISQVEYLKWEEQGGTQWNPNTKTGNSFGGISMREYVDPIALADVRGKGFKASGYEYHYSNPDGKWIRSGVNGKEYVSEQEVQQAMTDMFSSDKKFQEYYGQQYDLDSYLNGGNLKDIKGNNITKSDYINYYANKGIDFAVQKYAYEKTKSGTTSTTADPYGLITARNNAKKDYYKWKKDYDEKLVNEKFINSTDRVVKIFSDNDWNPETIKNNMEQNKLLLSSNRKEMFNLKQQELQLARQYKEGKIDKAEYDLKVTSVKERYNELEDTNNNLHYQQANLSMIDNMATNKSLETLNKNGKLAIADIETFNNFNKLDDGTQQQVLSDLETYNRLLQRYNQLPTLSPGQLKDPSRFSYERTDNTVKTFEESVLENGYSSEDLKRMRETYNQFQNIPIINKTVNEEKQQWFATNDEYNQYATTGVDLTPLTGDAYFNSRINSMVMQGKSLPISSTLYNNNSFVEYKETGKTGGWVKRVFTKQKPFTLEEISTATGLKIEEFATIQNAEATPDGTIYTYKLDKDKLAENNYKIKTDVEEQPVIVAVKLPNRTGAGEFTERYIAENYTPENERTAGALDMLSGTDVNTIATVENQIVKTVYGDFVKGKDNTYTPNQGPHIIYHPYGITQQAIYNPDTDRIDVVTYDNGTPITFTDMNGDIKTVSSYNLGQGGAHDMAVDINNYIRNKQNQESYYPGQPYTNNN